MVRDGYYYGLALIGAGILLGWLTDPAWAILPILLACFFLWFFRDPERAIPEDPGTLVSPGRREGYGHLYRGGGSEKRFA